MMHGFDSGLLVLVLIVWACAVGGSVWAADRLIHRPRSRPSELPSPLEVLERRYAEGQISREDFDEARARLREYDLDR